MGRRGFTDADRVEEASRWSNRRAVVVAQIASAVVIAAVVGRGTATTGIDHDVAAARRTAGRFVNALLTGDIGGASRAASENISTETLTSIALEMASAHMTLRGSPRFVAPGPIVPITGERLDAGYRFDLLATDPKTGRVTSWMFLAAVESSDGAFKINGFAFRATSPVLSYGTQSPGTLSTSAPSPTPG